MIDVTRGLEWRGGSVGPWLQGHVWKDAKGVGSQRWWVQLMCPPLRLQSQLRGHCRSSIQSGAVSIAWFDQCRIEGTSEKFQQTGIQSAVADDAALHILYAK